MGTESKKKVKIIVPIDDKMQPAYDHYLNNNNNIINIKCVYVVFSPLFHFCVNTLYEKLNKMIIQNIYGKTLFNWIFLLDITLLYWKWIKTLNKNTYCYIWVKKSNKTYTNETKGKSYRTISYLLRAYLLNVKK